MAFTWASPFGSAFSQAYSEEESRQRSREEEKQRTRALRMQADEMQRQAEMDLYLRNAGIQASIGAPPQAPQPPQPGQPSQAAPPQGSIPGQGGPGLQPPPTAQPIRMGGAGIPGQPGTPSGPAPIRPYSSPGTGPAAGAMPPQPQQPQGIQPPPPTPEQVLDQRDKQRNSPMRMYQDALAQLNKSHPNDPRNTDAALRYVEKFKPIFDAERQDELAMLKLQHEADQVALRERDQYIKENWYKGKLGIEQSKETRLAALLPDKKAELAARTDLERMRAGKLKVDIAGGVPLQGTGLSVDGGDLAAYNYLFYQKMPPGIARSGKAGHPSPESMQIINRAAQIASTAGLSPAEASALSGEKKSELVSLNNMVRWRDGVAKSEQAVQKAMTIVKDYQSRLQLSTSQDLNALIIETQRRLGNRDAQPFVNAIRTLQNEYARVMSGPNSNAQLHEGAMGRAEEMLSKGMTPDQLDETFVEMKRQMDAQIEATDGVINDRRASFSSLGPAAGGSSGAGKVVDFASLPK